MASDQIMKILHVTQGYAPARGGTEFLIQRVSEELVRQFGDEVTVYTTDCYNGEAFFRPELPHLPLGWEEINGVRVRRFPVRRRVSQFFRFPQAVATRFKLPFNQYMRALAQGPLIPGLERAIRGFPSDVIAASSFPLWHMFAALRAAMRLSRPCILAGGLHPLDRWGFDRPMIYEAVRKAAAYIAYTDFEAANVIERGASPSRVFTIGAGVDPEPFGKVVSGDAKRRLGIDGKPVVGFIGQLGRHKGVDALIRAMPSVWKSVPEAHVLIAGARTAFAADMESAIRRLPESDRGRIVLQYDFAEEDKPWYYAATDVVAYPSGYESFGITFLEAWASGKPVIGCNQGAIPCVVQAGIDGLLVPFQKEKKLAEAIILLLRNPNWARGLGERGRQKVMNRYTWHEIAQRFRQVYAGAIREEGRRESGQ